MKIFWKKKTKKVISRKLKGFEQSNLQARSAILESTLIATNYRVWNFKFCKLFGKSSFQVFEKITKIVVSGTLKGFGQS